MASLFDKYISTLQGGIKVELIIPISAYNPMKKVKCIEKVKKLIEIKAEEIVENAISNISIDASIKLFTISINLADDAAGSWTNAYTTHNDYTFKPSAFLSRNMDIILLFSSQMYNEKSFTNWHKKLCLGIYINKKMGFQKHLKST